MSFVAILLLALALSADAFAVAVGKGVALRTPRLAEALRIGLVFGAFQGLMPVLGWALGSVAADSVAAWDHWIAFVLLGGLGARTVMEGLRGHAGEPADDHARQQHGWGVLLLAGVATSIDALVAGVTLAFADVGIGGAAFVIGVTTAIVVTGGVLLGRVVGTIAGKRAEVVGGLVLIAIGASILVEHLRAG